VAESVIIHDDGTRDYGQIVRVGDGWQFNFPPSDLSFLRVDHQARLQFGPTEVVIESPFVLQLGGADYFLDPGDRRGLGPFLNLYPNSLAAASVDARGTLTLAFTDRATITVPADPQFEAWQVNGPGTFLVVCVPGTSGELAIWK
jgi:hypothetical protein